MTTAPPVVPGSAAAVMLLDIWRSGGRAVAQVTWPWTSACERSDVQLVLENLHLRFAVEIDVEVARPDEAEILLGPHLFAQAVFTGSSGSKRPWYHLGVEPLRASLTGRVVNDQFVASHTGLDHTDIPLGVILAGQPTTE